MRRDTTSYRSCRTQNIGGLSRTSTVHEISSGSPHARSQRPTAARSFTVTPTAGENQGVPGTLRAAGGWGGTISQVVRVAGLRLARYSGLARLQSLAVPIGDLMEAAAQLPADRAACYLIDAKPLPACHRVRHGRVRLLREDGAYWGKTSKGCFFGFKLHFLRHSVGRIVNVVLTPGNWDD